ncbi:hypothetical protein [Embleya sp. NPDC020886]|uniref:hypothetical protein n=1 Tax=Embleya sp. NPDC020886 TaxID=3363980 RepID=UPI00379B3F66
MATRPRRPCTELLPFRNRHGLTAAIGVYELVAQAVGADKVTAGRLRESLALLPGDLTIGEDDPAAVAQSLAGVIEGTQPPAPTPSTALPSALQRDVDRRAVALADRFDRGRIPAAKSWCICRPRSPTRGPRVFEAALERMKTEH